MGPKKSMCETNAGDNSDHPIHTSAHLAGSRRHSVLLTQSISVMVAVMVMVAAAVVAVVIIVAVVMVVVVIVIQPPLAAMEGLACLVQAGDHSRRITPEE